MGVEIEMPKYRSHKIVHALRIRVFYQNETDGTPATRKGIVFKLNYPALKDGDSCFTEASFTQMPHST